MSARRPNRLQAVLLSCAALSACYTSRTRESHDAGGGAARADAGRPSDTGARRDAGATRDAGPRRDAAAARGKDAGSLSDPAAGARDAAADAQSSPPPPPSTDPGLRVAFIGDQGLGSNAVRVLELIRDEGANLVLHQGDLDYVDDPAAWLAQLDAVLGAEFPYFVSVGNHDLPSWDGPAGYQALLEERLAATPGASCSGRLGVSASCLYRGLFFVLSGVGTLDTGHEAYLDAALAGSDRVFKLCSWHKNQHDMQVGAKTDEVGWAAYQICQQHGALIVTGHEHSYSRTYTLSGLGDATLGHGALGAADLVTLDPGHTAVVVTGLGGRSRRPFLAAHADDSWWAAVYALERQVQNGLQTGSATSIEDGALFIDFHVDGDPRLARGYFKTSAGSVVDSFTIVAPAP
jgi:hypothetical protein